MSRFNRWFEEARQAERPPAGPGIHWRHAVQKTSRGTPIANAWNAELALKNDPLWAGRLRYDAMRHAELGPAGELDDVAILRIMLWFQGNGFPRMTAGPVREAISIVARDNEFHPVRDWLEKLEWDGRSRLWSWLPRFVGTVDDEYHRQVSGLFLTAMVARIFEPGCQNDYALVLEGPQGYYKSSLCRILAGEYFSSSLPPLDGDAVRLAMHLRDKWLVEIAELSAFQRADNEKLKAFVTNPVERFTPKYARQEITEARQCVFVGTTNKFVWMKDETGGRRFWPVRCGQRIDLAGFKAEREQLFAEAVDFYREEHRWWPQNELENALFEPQQAERYEADAWLKLIIDWDFAVPRGRELNGDVIRQPLSAPYYLVDIAEGAIGIQPERFNVADQRRLTATLEHGGWQRAKRTKRGIPWLPV